MAEISPKAVVANPAGLADDVQVGPFSFVGPEATVGPGTVIANNVTVTGRTTIGAGAHLFPGCVVGSAPSGADGADAACRIGAGNVIREHVTVEAGAALGDHNLLMVGCQVAHDAVLAGEGIFANFTRIAHHARIEPFVRTSGSTAIEAYATVGAYAFTTGYAEVRSDVPPYAIVQGVPVRVRGLNVENLRRCGFDAASIEALKHAFRSLFNGSCATPTPEQLTEAEAASDNEYVRHLVGSLRRSAAGADGRALAPTTGT